MRASTKQKEVLVPTWSIIGGFVVLTFKRPTKGGTQDGTQDDNLDKWIENQIRQNPQITTEELAKLSGKRLRTIKRHIAQMPHIRYVGGDYSGHWEVDEEQRQ